MRLSVAHIIYNEWVCDMRDVHERSNLAARIVSRLQKVDPPPELLILPAGFLMCRKKTDCESAAKHLARNLPADRPTVVFGVDYRKSCKENAKKQTSVLPYFAHVVAPNRRRLIRTLRQQGANASSRVKANDLDMKARCFTVGDKNIGLIVCGEMTTRVTDIRRKPRVPEYIAQKTNVDLIVDIAHGNLRIKPRNRSWFPAMEATGVPCVVAEHLKRTNIVGPNYSHGLRKPTSISTDEYCLKIYDLF